MIKQGITTPTVWAHTIAAHTTRNRRLRVFSSIGSADFPSLLFAMRAPDDATLRAYVSRTDATVHRLNLIRMVHLHSALYMPWGWARTPVTRDHPGYNAVAAQEAKALLDELRAEIGVDGVGGERPQTVGINDAGTHIFGTLLYGPDTRTDLSEHFTLEGFTRFGGALPLPLDLVRKLQMLRYSVGCDLEITGLVREPAAKRLILTIKASKNKSVFVEKASKMRDEGLCFTAVEEGPAADEFVLHAPE